MTLTLHGYRSSLGSGVEAAQESSGQRLHTACAFALTRRSPRHMSRLRRRRPGRARLSTSPYTKEKRLCSLRWRTCIYNSLNLIAAKALPRLCKHCNKSIMRARLQVIKPSWLVTPEGDYKLAKPGVVLLELAPVMGGTGNGPGDRRLVTYLPRNQEHPGS